ncbi:MAG: bifunctional pyr operon transcriptional regulator/uracil phosphoribosyltransferase PyrR [Sumerlaeia bacterium]
MTAASPNSQSLLDADGVARALDDLAATIAADFPTPPDTLMLLGIRTRGVTMADRLHERLQKHYGRAVAFGTLDITLYRDDLSELKNQPIVRGSEFPHDVDGAVLILTDDVIYTGRTIRAAMDEIVDYGRPKLIRLACLVDRGHREYPIQPDYVGLRVETTLDQVVKVKFAEDDGEDGVELSPK